MGQIDAVSGMAINIILDESDMQSPIFVEIENDNGKAISIGERLMGSNGLTTLRITISDIIKNKDI